MQKKNKNYNLYKEEILELTDLLNNEWVDLKQMIIDKGINLKNALLVGYYEDQKGKEHGLILTDEKKMFLFEANENQIKVQQIENIEKAAVKFPQILVAIDL